MKLNQILFLSFSALSVFLVSSCKNSESSTKNETPKNIQSDPLYNKFKGLYKVMSVTCNKLIVFGKFDLDSYEIDFNIPEGNISYIGHIENSGGMKCKFSAKVKFDSLSSETIQMIRLGDWIAKADNPIDCKTFPLDARFMPLNSMLKFEFIILSNSHIGLTSIANSDGSGLCKKGETTSILLNAK